MLDCQFYSAIVRANTRPRTATRANNSFRRDFCSIFDDSFYNGRLVCRFLCRSEEKISSILVISRFRSIRLSLPHHSISISIMSSRNFDLWTSTRSYFLSSIRLRLAIISRNTPMSVLAYLRYLTRSELKAFVNICLSSWWRTTTHISRRTDSRGRLFTKVEVLGFWIGLFRNRSCTTVNSKLLFDASADSFVWDRRDSGHDRLVRGVTSILWGFAVTFANRSSL
jgi:hypothetical protein